MALDTATTPDSASTTPRALDTASLRRRPAGRKLHLSIGHHLGTVGLTATVILILLPVAFTISTAFRPSADVSASPLALPTAFTLGNFTEVIGRMDYVRSVGNSVVILVASLFITVILGALAAYPLARISNKWSNGVYRIFIAGTTIPVFVLIAPLYLLQRDLGLLNTHVGVILTYCALNLPVAIFFYTSFLRQIPVELEEAASLDGAGPLRIFLTILFPLLRPITATLATFLTLSIWNDLIIPLVFLRSPELRTVMVNAYAQIGTYSLDPTILFPAALLGVAPLLIVFIALQRQVVAGLTMGAVK
ncbi:carbohydrate ABC transporter permease [Clavibacter michiganensis]|nr:carbohydrate ABC transporter permease [Clavibacter michiganensis]